MNEYTCLKNFQQFVFVFILLYKFQWCLRRWKIVLIFLLLMQTHRKQVFSKREKKLCAFKEGKFVMFRLIVQQTKIASVCFFQSQKPSSSPPPLLSRSKMAKNLAFLYRQCSNCTLVVKKMPSMHLSMFECKKILKMLSLVSHHFNFCF